MGRNRIYASDADRQRAHRQRTVGMKPEPPRVSDARRRRPPSRPARLASLQCALDVLKQEYESWLESLPDSLQETDQAARATETIEQLEAVLDLLSEIQPPRGFGRD